MVQLRHLLRGPPAPPPLLEATVHFVDETELHTVAFLRQGTQDYMIYLPGRSLAELLYIGLDIPEGANIFVETDG